MSDVRWTKELLRLIKLAIMVFACVPTQLTGQVASGRTSLSAFHGPATVSIATLQVPMKAWKHFDKARSRALQEKYAESEKEVVKAIEIAPRFAEAYLLKASLEIHAGKFEAAIADIVQARALAPELPWSGTVLAAAYNGLRRYADAKATLDSLHGQESLPWQVKYETARAATGLNDIGSALRWSEEALKDAPTGFADAHLVRSNAMVIAHRWAEAVGEMEAYLAMPGKSLHKSEVLAVLPDLKRRAADSDLLTLASR